MRNIKLTIEYDGTNYQGWQRQKVKSQKSKVKSKTIQETLESTSEKILQEKIKLIASGRTDAGVHANGQVANFKTKSLLPADTIKKALNSLLPEDIRIKALSEVDKDFHSRFNVKSKIYRYTLWQDSYTPPCSRFYVRLIPYRLNLTAMRKAARGLFGCHDFRAFQTDSTGFSNNTRRTIKNIKLKKDGSMIYIDIEADGFLYNMARSIAGTLIEVGRGYLKPSDVKKILESRDRREAGPVAPARGLCLMEVRYE